MQKINLSIFVFVLAVTFLFPAAPKAHANILDDVINGVKKIFTPEPNQEFTIDSKIELAPNGDIDKNGQIDAGDTIRFTYTLINKTDKEYAFAQIKTNLDRKMLNFIHNIKGTASLKDDGKTITFPNYRIRANQLATISFDARINYFTDKDPLVTTEADFQDKDKKTVVKSQKKEITAKRTTKSKVEDMFKQEVKKRQN